MISVTEARLILFQWANTNPTATRKKTGTTGASGLKSSIFEEAKPYCLQRGKQDEAERFTEFDDRAEVVMGKIGAESIQEIPCEQRKKGQRKGDPQSPAPEVIDGQSQCSQRSDSQMQRSIIPNAPAREQATNSMRAFHPCCRWQPL